MLLAAQGSQASAIVTLGQLAGLPGNRSYSTRRRRRDDNACLAAAVGLHNLAEKLRSEIWKFLKLHMAKPDLQSSDTIYNCPTDSGVHGWWTLVPSASLPRWAKDEFGLLGGRGSLDRWVGRQVEEEKQQNKCVVVVRRFPFPCPRSRTPHYTPRQISHVA